MEYQIRESILPLNKDYPLIEKLFAIRGIDPYEKHRYLTPEKDEILDPSSIDRIHEGLVMLTKHIANGDRAFMIVDCDVDGVTSSALFLNYLNYYYPHWVQNKVDYILHEGKQHGIESQFVKQIIEGQYKFVICIDSSSNDYEEHKALRDAGIDVLVIDHHEAEKVSENACVINNQLCDYPTKSLSGVGMAYKFCCYMDKLAGRYDAEKFLDLVAVGLVGDVMSLRDFETRALVYYGITAITNPFLKEISNALSFSISSGGGINPFTIGYYIAPSINATIRVGSQAEKRLLFESFLDFKAYMKIPSTKRGMKGTFETIVEQACRNCNNLKNHQNKARDEGLEQINYLIKQQKLDEDKIIIVQIPPNLNISKNITGLIANNLMANYQHPVLLLNRTTDEEGHICWEGSGRGCSSRTFTNFKEFLQQSNMIMYGEGHQQAFGCGVRDEMIIPLRQYANEQLKDCNFSTCYKVDCVWQGSNFNYYDILAVADLASVWGQDFEQPVFAFENVPITRSNVELLSRDKNPTLKIKFSNGVSAIKFKASIEEFEELIPNDDYGMNYITIIGTCDINEFNGNITPQIKVKEYEITRKNQYNF